MKALLVLLVLNAQTGEEISRSPVAVYDSVAACVPRTTAISAPAAGTVSLLKCLDMEEPGK